jgi:hypothetical protein
LRDHGVDLLDQTQLVDQACHQAMMVQRVTRVGVRAGCAGIFGG